MVPNRIPMERERICLPSQWLLYSLMSTGVPEKGALLQNGGKQKFTVHRFPRGRKAYIQWGAALFPKGIINDTAITTPVPCSLQYDTFCLGWGRPEPR
jgi:hypothetical protein